MLDDDIVVREAFSATLIRDGFGIRRKKWKIMMHVAHQLMGKVLVPACDPNRCVFNIFSGKESVGFYYQSHKFTSDMLIRNIKSLIENTKCNP